jgi:hypothetical protein
MNTGDTERLMIGPMSKTEHVDAQSIGTRFIFLI